MKKFLIGGGLSFFAFALCAIPALAEKNNANGAQTYAWNLSGDVMPVPPYGSGDIIGSDTASKLIINQPDCTGKVNITGVMNGLNSNTEYTVYLSNPYTKYEETGWNVAGTWNFDLISTKYPGTYSKTMTISQDISGNITGSGTNVPAGLTWSVTGNVVGNTINFSLAYNVPMSGYVASFTGNIQTDGTINGTWSDNWFSDSGSWHTTSSAAVKIGTGDTGWSGQLGATTPFTFTTDENGSGSWHYNLDPAVNFSVWINVGGRTILISNNVTLKTSCESDSEEITTGTKADILKNSGVKGKGILTAPGLQKPFNGNSQAAEHAGKKK